MNDTWHFLREFESKDLVKRYIKKKYDFELNSTKAYEIVSAFKQGRGYFDSVKVANISVKPLLLYYGIVSLSRGLILILNKKARENNIKPSHGLKITNWSKIAESGKLEDIIVKSSNGTFKELITATKNKSYFRAGSNGINWHAEYLIYEGDYEFNLKELSYSFPDLKKSTESWLGLKIPSRKLNNLKRKEISKTEIEVQGKELLNIIFPDNVFRNSVITEGNLISKIIYDGKFHPHLCQKWASSFDVIGAPYVIPPFNEYIFMNDISKMFAISFIFGTISRYYPTTWNNINSGIKNDSILPFTTNLMDFLQEKYPQIIIDFIESPFEFEK
ncbi:YaaC family protein [Tenacibaculum sp. HL-MS23]|uniref:YaaC family protein n=1 Tax=Tenacibaculum sp. HL-MS23 TaxID=3077734 RepID=UPI0028FC31EB|nr:YaaC family protein [Tenacibaculum sp. HL-MS23]WNW01348.1 YaaC family protein [Tenacibaculum sp. HL-MS23]